jgi:Zn-dependent protease
MNLPEIINIAAIIIALMVAIIGHEIMHGRVAYYFEDETAKRLGRLSINPIVHIDLVGTILLPALLYFSNAGFLFGWAKPVPINIKTVVSNGGYNGAIAVSLAGIIYNFSLAIIAIIALKFIPAVNSEITLFLKAFLTYSVIYNIILGLFNLLPIPPLDGSQALGFIFRKINLHEAANFLDKIGQYGMILLLIIIATPLSQFFFAPMREVIDFAFSL